MLPHLLFLGPSLTPGVGPSWAGGRKTGPGKTGTWPWIRCPHRHVELPFHWQTMKPNLQPLMPGETYSLDSLKYHPDRETAFSILPERGVLSPHADHEFILSFSPHEVKMMPS